MAVKSFNGFSTVFTVHQSLFSPRNRMGKIFKLPFMEIMRRIDLPKKIGILPFPFFQQGFFAFHRPQIIVRRLGNPGHSRNKHGATVCLNSDGCAVFSMNMHLPEQSGILRVAYDDISQSAVL